MGKMGTNCWEIIGCGMEENGYKAKEDGEVCPAAIDVSHDMKNNGKNAGRYCWKVAGTMSNEERKGYYVSIVKSCDVCQFYKFVKQREGASFIQ